LNAEATKNELDLCSKVTGKLSKNSERNVFPLLTHGLTFTKAKA
jgi:hypothetical protein